MLGRRTRGEGKFLEGTVLVFKLVLKAERSSGRVAILRWTSNPAPLTRFLHGPIMKVFSELDFVIFRKFNWFHRFVAHLLFAASQLISALLNSSQLISALYLVANGRNYSQFISILIYFHILLNPSQFLSNHLNSSNIF